KRPPVTTTVFAATTPENTSFAYRASTSANPNPMISLAFVEANYELEPRPRPTRETTLPLRLRSPGVRMQRKRVVGFEEAPNREGSRAGRNAEGSMPLEIEAKENGNRRMNLPPLLAAYLGRNESGQPLQSSLTFVYGGHHPSTNIGGNLPPNAYLWFCSRFKEKELGQTPLNGQWSSEWKKTYIWIEAREVATNGALNDRRENFKRSKKSSWDNNRGQKSRDRADFPPCERNKERAKSSKNQVEGKKDKGAMPAEAPILMIRQKESYTRDNVSEEFISGGREITFPSVTRGSNSSASVIIKLRSLEERKDINAENGNHSFHHLRSHQIPYAKRIRTVFSTHESDKIKEGMKKVRETPPASIKGVLSCAKAKENSVINDRYPEQRVTNGKQLPNHFKERLRDLLRSNADVFAWNHADMTGIPKTIMIEGKPFKTEHKLNEYSHIKPIKQKRWGIGPDRNTSACKEVEELTKARILRKVKHQT
ncbi:hypothetical protein Tco_0976698, partial [Tanacetum coccineum]